MIGLCYLLSSNRKKIDWWLVLKGTFLQLFFAVFMLKTTVGQVAFSFLDTAVMKVLGCANAGATFVFSKVLADSETAGKLFGSEQAFIFAFQALPSIIFLSSLVALLYHFGLMQKVVSFLGTIMKKTLRISGAEACSAAANVFLGHTEAPLVVRPFLARMTTSELFCVMVGGMATIAGSVLGSYVAMLKDFIPDIAGHLVAASVMSAPAAIVFAKIMCPEDSQPETMGKFNLKAEKIDANLIDACTRGCSEGLKLALNVAAMLVGFLSLIALLNLLWGTLAGYCGWTNCNSIEALFGWIFSPLALLLGVPMEDMHTAGVLLGEKSILNEFVAYFHFAEELTRETSQMTLRTRVIISYALCGFSNLGAIGIQVGAFATMVPNRRAEISRLAFKALIAGSFASFSTAIIAGWLV